MHENQHTHLWSVTLEYAMETLYGIAMSEDSVMYEGEKYISRDGVSVAMTVNGNEVKPKDY
ncbi:hypothetical protein [Haladaptatus halobius]|uniref:hypothetical protein n=1 Tax=Haladaptatus halobius TaxID=2884875 RepID=UPI001D0A4559|nr:hypothetical protein [Haladaptatus halobius]